MSLPILPAIFIGHGSPMHQIEKNVYREQWEFLGKKLLYKYPNYSRNFMYFSALGNSNSPNISNTAPTINL